jgi:hypothetical protein
METGGDAKFNVFCPSKYFIRLKSQKSNPSKHATHMALFNLLLSGLSFFSQSCFLEHWNIG